VACVFNACENFFSNIIKQIHENVLYSTASPIEIRQNYTEKNVGIKH